MRPISHSFCGGASPAAMREVTRATIPPEIELAIGGQLQAMTGDGREISVTIVALTEETVTMDANHPLAGKDLAFDVELVEIA